MKIRNGFVSNSSSSSFVIASKDELTEEKLFELFKVDKNSFFYPMALNMVKTLINLSVSTSEKELLEDYRTDSVNDLPFEQQKLVEKEREGYKIYRGWASDDTCEAAETFLCQSDLDYEDDDLYVYKEGGY